MGYLYMWTTGFQLLKRKARAALWDDLMLSYSHYDPAHLCAPMASTASVRLLFWLKAHLRLHMGHFDITVALIHEAFGYFKIVFVRKMNRADGFYRHVKSVCLLKGNMYGGKSARN